MTFNKSCVILKPSRRQNNVQKQTEPEERRKSAGIIINNYLLKIKKDLAATDTGNVVLSETTPEVTSITFV